MVKTNYTPEDELDWLNKLVDSDGWKVFVAHLKPAFEESAKQLRAADCQNRDWIAGLVTAYDKIFRYPEVRIKQLVTELAKVKR